MLIKGQFTQCNFKGTCMGTATQRLVRFSFTTVACDFCSVHYSHHAKTVYNMHDLKSSMAMNVIGF